MDNQNQPNFQASPQQPIQSSLPENNMKRFSFFSFSRISVFISILITIVIVVFVGLGTYYLANHNKNVRNGNNNSTSNSKPNTQTGIMPSPPTLVSLLYVINEGRLFDHNFDTLQPVASHTYITSLDSVSKQEVNIGYNYNDVIHQEEKYRFFTTRSGKYVVRVSQSSIEIAPSNNVAAFKTIVNCDCKIFSYIFSGDESKIAYITKDNASNSSLYVSDLNGNRFQVKFPTPFTSPPLIAFDASNMKLALGSFGTNYSEIPKLRPQIISLDSNGNITKTEMSKNWDFLDKFSSDFKYVYLQTYTNDGAWHHLIEKYNLETGQSDKLLVIPEEGRLTDFMLSPLGNKLAFFFNSSNARYLYIINLNDNSVIKKNTNNSFAISNTQYTWSPNEKYIYLDGASCSYSSVCSEDGSGYLFDTQTQEVKLYFQSKGYVEAFSDGNQNNLHQIELMDFIGWLAQ